MATTAASGSGDTAIVWFRRDLRVHDHPALCAALERHERVVCVFVLDDVLLAGRHASPNRSWFLQGALASLHADLTARGAGLVVRKGRPCDELRRLADEVGAHDVYMSRDYGPYSRARDRSVAEAGLKLHARRGLLIHEPEDVVTGSGTPYRVYSPFRKRWEQLELRPVLAAPDAIASVDGLDVGVPAFAPEPTAEVEFLPEPTEAAARRRLADWCASGAPPQYKADRDFLAIDATSKLSTDLHFGLLSGRTVHEAVRTSPEAPNPGTIHYIQELCWRDFYAQVLWYHPHVVRSAFKPNCDLLEWGNDPQHLAAWYEGRTGYPVVDAAMRQLVATGWMHNRARMIVASFLTKDLWCDWRLGEAFFMRHLVDGDLASNNGGWQWSASTGTDAQPYFRIFSPISQGTKFDPSGEFVRRWVPELADVALNRLHAPWTMTEAEQAAANCRIGVDYPAPIVDHAVARDAALAAFQNLPG